VSRRAQRFFGCLLPLTLFVGGCLAFLMVGYAGQVLVQVERVEDAAMEPVLVRGWTVVINNTAFWPEEPWLGAVVSLGSPDGRVMRRIYALPGETVEVRGGEVLVDGRPPPVRDHPHGEGPEFGPLTLGPGEYFVLAEDRSAPDSRTWGPVARERLFGVPTFWYTDDDPTLQPFEAGSATGGAPEGG